MAKKNDVCRCIARVYRWGALRPHRCANPVWKDGYCKTHHMKIPALNLLHCKKQKTSGAGSAGGCFGIILKQR